MPPRTTAHPAPVRRKPGRPTQEASAALRQQFLDASLEAFLTKGFEGASIHAIARAAKISRDTFYRQFGSKEEVFRAATAHGLLTMRMHLSAIDYDDAPEKVFEQIVSQVFADSTTARAIAVLRLIVAETPRFPDVAAKMFADTREFQQPLVDYLERLRVAGVLDIDDAFEAALQLTMLAGGGIRFMLEPPPSDPAERKRYVDRVVSLALRGWLRKPTVRAGVVKVKSA